MDLDAGLSALKTLAEFYKSGQQGERLSRRKQKLASEALINANNVYNSHSNTDQALLSSKFYTKYIELVKVSTTFEQCTYLDEIINNRPAKEAINLLMEQISKQLNIITSLDKKFMIMQNTGQSNILQKDIITRHF